MTGKILPNVSEHACRPKRWLLRKTNSFSPGGGDGSDWSLLFPSVFPTHYPMRRFVTLSSSHLLLQPKIVALCRDIGTRDWEQSTKQPLRTDSTKQPSLTTSGILSVLIPFRFESLRFALVKSKLKEKPKESSNQHTTLLDVTLLYISTSQDIDTILSSWWKTLWFAKTSIFVLFCLFFKMQQTLAKGFFFLEIDRQSKGAAHLRVIWLFKYVLIINLTRVIVWFSSFRGDTN